MQYSRIMGIDYGDKRIGIALTDLMHVIASPFEVYKTVNSNADIEHLQKIIEEQEVETVVIGLPLNMDGSEGERARKTRLFGSNIADKSNVNIVFQDERLTSFEADNILSDAKVRTDKRKDLIDKLSACLILESYLNERSKNEKRGK
ncbi:MAG: Holliday junction resolvase RuvX [Clostridia bacterium]|nr:Holliday junction resolvase RuvX [Clostridia bacterium]